MSCTLQVWRKTYLGLGLLPHRARALWAVDCLERQGGAARGPGGTPAGGNTGWSAQHKVPTRHVDVIAHGAGYTANRSSGCPGYGGRPSSQLHRAPPTGTLPTNQPMIPFAQSQGTMPAPHTVTREALEHGRCLEQIRTSSGPRPTESIEFTLAGNLRSPSAYVCQPKRPILKLSARPAQTLVEMPAV